MLFNSYSFIFLFLPITFFGFFLLGTRRMSVGAAWLTLASLFFYGWWNPVYVTLLLTSIAFNYCIGVLIAKNEPAFRRKTWLVIGLAANLLLLAYYKYANFFLGTANDLAGTHWNAGEIILPLGISFFTFTQIAFLVDTYQGKVKEYNPIHYALFVSYFPHLIAGPVLHHKEMMPQFGNPNTYRLDHDDVAIGLTFFAIGLFKKAVLADGIAPFANSGFAAASSGQPLTLFEAWGGALAYTFQLYFDFSGYSDMAIGLSRLFGIRLPLNFDSPYKAVNIIDFWRRWHMTLSRFLRDYLYLPLGGNRKGKPRRYLNLMITMLLGGLWHGAGWTFVIWGGLHGCYLIVNHAWQALLELLGVRNRRPGFLPNVLAGALTFVAVVVGWVFFRAQTLDGALAMLKGMTGINGIALPSALAGYVSSLRAPLESVGIEFSLGGGKQFILNYLWIFGLAGIAFLLPNSQQFLARHDPGLLAWSAAKATPGRAPIAAARGLAWRPTRAWAIAIGVLLAGGVLTLSSVSEFLYFQF